MQVESKNHYDSHGKVPRISCQGEHIVVTDTFNCHHSGPTMSTMRSCFPRIFSWWSMAGILVLAHSHGSLDSFIGQFWLGNSLFSGWDFLRVVSTAVWDSACLILLLISLLTQISVQRCSLKAFSASSCFLPLFLAGVFPTTLLKSWSHLGVCFSDDLTK